MAKAPQAAPPPAPPRSEPWARRLPWLIPLLAAIAGAAVAATDESIPGWGRWTLAGTALAGAVGLGIAVLIGPASRRLAGERHPLTQAERQQMTATERMEAVNAARHTLIQAATGLVVIGGVVFTAQGLWYTAESLDASRQAQRTAEQGQITDRYTKAVEQLGSTKMDVRLGGTYALERLAQDSPRDHQTVYDVLAAFVREHDPKDSVKDKDLPPAPTTDVQAALTVVSRRDTTRYMRVPNLSQIRVPYANLAEANLAEANLAEANLAEANLAKANLAKADLRGADLTKADLTGSNLGNAELSDANLRGAYLTKADLRDTDLTKADLRDTDLREADLRNANLRDADLTEADLGSMFIPSTNRPIEDLTGANLTGANLRRVRGVTEDEIRKVARVNAATQF